MSEYSSRDAHNAKLQKYNFRGARLTNRTCKGTRRIMNEHRVTSVRWTSRQRGEKSRTRIFDPRTRNYCMERRSTANLNRIQSKLTYIALNNGMTNCCKYTQLLNFIALLEFPSRKINEKFKTSLLSSSSFSLFFFILRIIFHPVSIINVALKFLIRISVVIFCVTLFGNVRARERERDRSFIDQTKSTRNNGTMNVSLTCQSRRLLPRSNGCYASILDSFVRCSLLVSFREIFANIFQAMIIIII